ncbi:MAG: aldo/keto reductase [Bradyrhizobium sp.]|nr:aldo/keto reductase [Bradyrhizobium sp.]
MRYKTFGRHTGLLTSELALGVSLFGRDVGYGATPEDARAILDAYIDAGGNIVDTSSRYRFGQSEEMLGSLMGDKRSNLIVASKYSRGDVFNAPLATLGASRKTMVQSVEASLRRLQTDRIDILFVHMDDYLTPIEEIVRGFDDLIGAGKIVYGAFSNYPAWRLAYGAAVANVRGWAPICGMQIEYSLLQRTPERELLPMADACGLGVLAYSPLAGGLLTGKYRKGEGGRAVEYKEALLHEDAGECADVISEVVAVSEAIGAPASQVAIAWMLTKGVFPLVGPRTPKQLADNLGALDLKLEPEHVKRLERASAITMGYPHDLASAPAQREINTGGRQHLIDMPDRVVL